MYKKVSTDMNFVDREKQIEKFWDDNHIFEKSMEERKDVRIIFFMTALRQQTESRTLVMC